MCHVSNVISACFTHQLKFLGNIARFVALTLHWAERTALISQEMKWKSNIINKHKSLPVHTPCGEAQTALDFLCFFYKATRFGFDIKSTGFQSYAAYSLPKLRYEVK